MELAKFNVCARKEINKINTQIKSKQCCKNTGVQKLQILYYYFLPTP